MRKLALLLVALITLNSCVGCISTTKKLISAVNPAPTAEEVQKCDVAVSSEFMILINDLQSNTPPTFDIMLARDVKGRLESLPRVCRQNKVYDLDVSLADYVNDFSMCAIGYHDDAMPKMTIERKRIQDLSSSMTQREQKIVEVVLQMMDRGMMACDGKIKERPPEPPQLPQAGGQDS
jgi:hypothetical protein